MKMLSELNYPFQFNWYIQEHVAVIGWAFDVNNQRIENEHLASLFIEIINENSFVERLKNLNGNFAVVIESKNITALAVDHIRSFPLLYKQDEKSIQIVTNYNWQSEMQIDESSVEAFKKCWCTLDNTTLAKNIFQLQAGQYLWQSGNEPATPKFYYQHIQKDKVLNVDINEASKLFTSVFDKYFDLIKDKTVLVPLSGGYDSRLMISLLHQYGHSDVIAYTYGKEESHEVQIAKKVAQQLNVKWYFIEYNETLFNTFFTDQWQEYSDNNHFLSSLPHEQDFFALSYLKSKNLIPENFVALPGFSGDLLGGSITGYQPNEFSKVAFKNMIIQKHFQNSAIDYDFSTFEAINSKDQFYDQYQCWFVNNKVTKFIVNSVRLYEYFGGSWLLPFWDKELIEYWYKVPYNKREQQKFYNDVIFKKFFSSLEIGYIKPGHDDNYPNQLKEKIKQHLPSVITNVVKKVKKSIQPNDVNNLSVLSDMIEGKIEQKVRNAAGINNIHAIYFLQKLEK
ncbi:MAG: asparagine synthase-related protein [Chitinophagales bacterium]